MTPRQDNRDVKEAGRVWLGLGKFLLLLVFAVLLFWLGESMVQHRFFRGGGLDYRLSSGR